MYPSPEPLHLDPDDPGDDLDPDDDPFEPPPSAVFNLPLSPQHVQTFLAVVDAGGRMSAAATQIGMSQPGVSHQLNELERRLNIRLLDRARGRAARMTRPGRIFERYARQIVELQGSLYADLERMARDLGGHMRVGSSPGPGEHWLPPLLCAFREHNAQLQIELHVGDARSIVEQVFENEIELGFVGGRWSRSGLQFEPIYHDEFVLIAAPDHPLANRTALRLARLEGIDFIAQEPGTGLRMTLEQELSDRELATHHFNVIAELGNQESVKSAVLAGYGIGCVWRGSVATELGAGALVVLDVADFAPDNNFYVVRRSHRRLSRRSRALLDFIRLAREEEERVRKRNAP